MIDLTECTQVLTEILTDTKCRYNTDGTLNALYRNLHLKWYNRRLVGAIGIRNTNYPGCVSGDVWFRRGYLDTSFIKEAKEYNRDFTILLQIKETDLPARLLARTCGFKRNKSRVERLLGYYL